MDDARVPGMDEQHRPRHSPEDMLPHAAGIDGLGVRGDLRALASKPADVAPSVVIDQPPVPVAMGASVVITGKADRGTHYWIDPVTREVVEEPMVEYRPGVRVVFDTGEVFTSSNLTWSVTVKLARRGVHKATASATTTHGQVISSAEMVFVAGAPTVAIVEPPADGRVVPLQETGADLVLSVTTDWLGELTVKAYVDGKEWGPLSTRSTTVHLGPMPLGNRSITVVATPKVAPQLLGRAGRTVIATDDAPPHLTVVHPSAGGKTIPRDGRVTLEGRSADAQSGMVGGQASVSVSLSAAGPWLPGTPRNPGDWSDWTTTVPAPPSGPFTVYLKVSDASGNTTSPLEWPLEAVTDYVPATLSDRLSDSVYLSALMAFARDQVKNFDGPAAEPVTAQDLAGVLQQPVDRMAVPLSAAAAAGQVPVNELRVPLEIIRFMMAGNNIPPDPEGQARYLQTAYEALLLAAGTTYSELRLARGADKTTRGTLAARLGIALYGYPASSTDRPDQLDALTLDGAALTEAELERLFGLPLIAADDPLRAVAPSQLLTWQLATQSSSWQAEDLASPPLSRAYVAVVDPDIITAEDVRPDSPQSARVLALLQARTIALADQGDALRMALDTAASPQDKLVKLLAAGLPEGTPSSALADWQAQEASDGDISASLAKAGLDRAGYLYLQRLRALTEVTDATAAEWDTAVQVLIAAFRRRQYADWLIEEDGIVLSPELFTGEGSQPSVSRYRIDPRARADWLNILEARTWRRRSLVEASGGMVAAAEAAALPVLRDALLQHLKDFPSNMRERLTGIFNLNFSANGTVSTTRMAQATASLQNLLEQVRSGDVNAESPAYPWRLRNSTTSFDDTWKWLGGIDSWRHATTAFLFPEAALDPALLNPTVDPDSGISSRFAALCSSLQDLAGIASPDEVSTLVDAYIESRPPSTTKLYYLSGRDLAHQRSLADWSKATYGSGDVAGATEAFWAVPMLAGQRLLAAGLYKEALDWLWVVYPYNDPQAPSSFFVINDENSIPPTPPDLTFPPDWTSDLNPFHRAKGRPAPYLRYTLLTIVSCLTAYGDDEFTTSTDASVEHARTLYLSAAGLLGHPRFMPVPPAGPGEAALELPQVGLLRTRVATQQAKLDQGRNIAGLPRVVAGAPSSSNAVRQPTPYHFRVLLASAEELVQQAGQLEAQYLSLMEKYEAKQLQWSDAGFAAGIAGLQTKVHDARVQEATDGVKAADAQKARADTMEATYREALEAPANQYERELLDQYRIMHVLQDMSSHTSLSIALGQMAAGINWTDMPWTSIPGTIQQSVGLTMKMGLELVMNNLQSQMQANQLRAGIETRQQERAIQRVAAEQDVLVAATQQTLSQDQVAIAEAERDVAEKQSQHAKATLALLSSQFTNPDLYLWMSDTLGGVYRYFLQQATATARLAQEQLAFQRVEPVTAFIADDYWKASQGSGRPPPAADTKGMTGAERLTQDLARLDQYAFSTDERRLNVSQTFSLAQMLPVDFLQFRKTGQLSLATPMSWFDQDFPGHYQRLIRQVRLSLVALIPPSRGIRASLGTTGISRVTTPEAFGSFTEVIVRRDPSTVSVTSPVNATGVFELDLQPEMLLPFEGSGVDTAWHLDMPQAANPFDLSSVADVLLHIDYTALADPGYQEQVIRRLNADRNRRSDRVFSIARDFPDQWYELNNPAAGTSGRSATLDLHRDDFPYALSGLLTAQVAVRLSTQTVDPLPPVQVSLTRTLGGVPVGGAATTDGHGIASTRRGAPLWNPLLETSPVGSWRVSLDSGADPLFDDGLLDDLLLVISWRGQAPAWPISPSPSSLSATPWTPPPALAPAMPAPTPPPTVPTPEQSDKEAPRRTKSSRSRRPQRKSGRDSSTPR